MADLITPTQDLIKYSRRLLVKQIFDFNMKKAISENPDMAFYGSLYTLIGTDSYIDSPTAQTTTTGPNGNVSVPVNLAPALSQDCVQLIQDGGAQVTIDYADTSQSKLAQLLIMQLSSAYPIRTVLPIPSFENPPSCKVTVAINGQFVCLDGDGKVMTVDASSSSSVPQIQGEVSQVSSAQSSVQSAMVTANQLFQGQMDSYLKNKATAVTPLLEAYADRFLKITITGSKSGATCTLTPAQLNRYAATWRLNSQVRYADAGAASGDSTSVTASWAEHLATSSASEVAKEIASLEAQNNFMQYLNYHQNERLGLIGTLLPLQQAIAMSMTLKSQSAMIDKLVNDYVEGTKPSSNSGSAAAAASS